MSRSRSPLKERLIGLLGFRAYRVLVEVVGRAQAIAWSVLTSRGRASAQRLRRWRGTYEDERCIIIGNGPSLRKTDWSLIRDEFTFGLNRIYLAFGEMGFTTDVLVSVNVLVLEQCHDDLVATGVPVFLSRAAADLVPSREDVVLLQPVPGPKFSRNPIWEGVWEGATVTYVAMQLAYWMGFSEVILIGVDHRFEREGEPHTEVISQGEDPDHFDPRYFGKGFRWQLPDLETSEIAYRLAGETFRADGRRIIDATAGGALTVFPKADLAEVLADG